MSDPAIQAIDAFIGEQGVDTSTRDWRLRLKAPPKLEFDPQSQYVWELDTSCGPVRVRLMPDVAPMHVSSTVYLTRLGFYDGLVFHRVIQGFMAQGGCPRGTGTGGPGYEYAGEFDRSVRHDRPGLLSMANAGPGTDGSQFFLTFVPTDWLDDKHTILGEVTEGLESLKAMEQRGSRGGETSERVELREAKISVEK